MSDYRRVFLKGGTFFFTVVTFRRQRILCHEEVRLALRKGIDTVRETLPFSIDAWVILPDHLHCVWTLPSGDGDYSKRWALIKKFVSKSLGLSFYLDDCMTESKRIRKESTVWQRRFWEHMIRNDSDYERHMDYIHYNPVKHGLVSRVKDWPYSTFHRYARNNCYHEDWGGYYRSDDDNAYGE